MTAQVSLSWGFLERKMFMCVVSQTDKPLRGPILLRVELPVNTAATKPATLT